MAIKADFKPYYSDFVFVRHSVSTTKGNIALIFKQTLTQKPGIA